MKRPMMEVPGTLDNVKRGRGDVSETSPVLQSIFDGIPDGILVIDRTYKVVMFNKAMERLMGKSSGEIEGRKCYFLCHNTDFVCDDCQAQAVFLSGMPPSRIRVCFRDNLTRKFEIWNFPIKDEGGRVEYMIEYIKDITERLEMEKELMQARNLALIGELSAKTAHEIRNPLNAMEGAAHYLINEYGDDPKIQKYLGLIKDQIMRLNNVTTSLLNTATPRLTLGEKSFINAVLLHSIDIVEHETREKDIDIEIFLDENLPKVRFDETKMQQVFVNLLKNACDAISASHGTIEIVGHIRQIKGQDYVEITMIDNGVGIPDDDSEKLFDSFYTTKKTGTGLGLAVVKDIMKSHGGYVLIERNPKGGTFASVGVPCHD